VTEDVKGISAAYTMGAASVRVMHNKSSDDNGSTGVDDEEILWAFITITNLPKETSLWKSKLKEKKSLLRKELSV